MNIVFFSTSAFGINILKFLLSDKEILSKLGIKELGEINLPLVITKKDMPNKRGNKLSPSPIKEYLQNAQNFKGEILTPDILNKDIVLKIKSTNPDIILSASYGKKIPNEILELSKYPLNVHASLLPKYRGPSPIQTSILNGDKTTGISIMYMSEEIDAGDIIMSKELSITTKNENGLHEYKSYLCLEDELSLLSIGLLKNLFETIKKREKVESKKQDTKNMSLTKIIKKENGELDFINNTAFENYLKVKALSNNPGTYFVYKDVRIKVTSVSYSNEKTEGEFGEINVDKRNGLVKVNSKGTTLFLEKIIMPGKKDVLVKDYLRGNSIF